MSAGVIPYSLHRLSTLTIRGRYLAVLATGLSLIAASAALVAAGVAQPDPGVRTEGARVVDVLPGGPAWNNGVRVDQRVLELVEGDSAVAWRLLVTDGRHHYASTAASHILTLRESISTATLALAIALAGTAVLRHAAALATGLASLAIVLVAVPLSQTGDPLLSSVAMLAAPAVGTLWLFTWRAGPSSLRVLFGAGASACLLFWLFARLGDPRLFASAETARQALMIFSGVTLGVFAVPWNRWSAIQALARGRPVDVALVSATAVSLTFGGFYFGLAPLFIGACFVAFLVVYSAVRRVTAPLLDRLLFAGLRERVSLEAVEDERARLSADIHDVPLQELIGVIHHLEATGEVGQTPDLLRRVAAHLRAVTTELRPPVLDDLGLGPAIAFLVDGTATAKPGVNVVNAVVDRTDVARGRRAPPLVELAVFRIVQEALTNAREHAGASTISVEGEVTPHTVAIMVRDDGRGLTAEAKEAASRRGHLGLTSMAVHAAAVDAVLSFDRERPSGTRITLLWRGSL